MSQIIAGKAKKRKSRSWPSSAPEDVGGENYDDCITDGTDYKGKMNKSFSDHVLSDPVLVRGMAEAPFLREMIKSIGGVLEKAEISIAKSLKGTVEETHTFDKSFAGALSTTGQSFMELDARIEALASTSPEPNAAAGQVEYLTKSQFGEGVSRSQVLDTLVKGVEAGEVAAGAVLKFESTGELDQVAGAFIQKSLGGV